MKRLIQLGGLFTLFLCAGWASAQHAVMPSNLWLSDWYTSPNTGGPRGLCDGTTNAAYTAGTITERWAPNRAYPLNHEILDQNLHLQKVTTAGTSATEYPPSWSTTGGTAADTSPLVWTDQGLAPGGGGHCAVLSLYDLNTTNNAGLAPFAPVYSSGDVVHLGAGTDYFGTTAGGTRPGTYYLNCLTNGTCPLPAVAGVTYEGTSSGSPAIIRGINGNSSLLTAASNDTFQYLDISDISACGNYSWPIACDSTQDWAQYGISFASTDTNVTVNGVNAHGLVVGFYGPTGTGFVGSGVNLLGNSSSGWNLDNGTTGTGTFSLTNFSIIGNGCAEEYPIVDAMPYAGCTDDNSTPSGGYGDGLGTATTTSVPGWQLTLTNGIVAYNTQDGIDTLHIAGSGSSVTETQILAYGNMGNQVKEGGATNTLTNSLLVGNCAAMQGSIPGFPSGYNTHLSDFCRGADVDAIVEMVPSLASKVQDNTFYSNNTIGLQLNCIPGPCDSTYFLLYNNNVFMGFADPRNFGDLPTPIYNATDSTLNALTNPGASWTNNSYLNQRSSWTCPMAGETAALCTDPGLTDETFHAYSYGNMSPFTGSSAVVAAGTNPSGISPIDYGGITRANPQTIGACETSDSCPGPGGAPTAATPSFSPVAGTYGGTQTVTISTATGGASLIYTNDGSTPTVTALSCTITHGSLYSGPLTVSTTQTLNAIACLSTYNASSVGTAAYVINGAAATPTFSPVAGTYTGTQSVTLSTASSGCAAYLVWNTTNAQSGGNLTGTSSTNPLNVASSETVYAQVQGCTGYLNSAIGSAAYTIAVVTPTCTPAAGTYSTTQSVTCSSTDAGSTTYCTIDGSTPTTGSPVCTSISVASTLTLKAISAVSGKSNSAILPQLYTFTSAPNVTIKGTVTILGTVTIK